MNIYFSGIGGVGLGPLAEIALDAGYGVQGSDISHSQTIERLQTRGVATNIGQDGEFLRACHDHRRIDWVVYTSALPRDHPELLAAQELGIKVTKRDELLARILSEKNLKLIAISGTHGKTTTTAMVVWVLTRLGVPISYSVGASLNFGPSGLFNPSSKYFVYECDEFDRNFLNFSPYLSLLTSIDYDHADTYPSEADYIDAFKHFIHQSNNTIMWHSDNEKIQATAKDGWILGEDEVISIDIRGAHNRRNATLVTKAIEHLSLGSQDQALSALLTFPGTSRRFERLADNLYSDYGHHPVEIEATLQLAQELSGQVVLVYQPHQNVRQHEIRDQYYNSFEGAQSIYWLPTYLSRENPDLPILQPEELIADIANKSKIHVADLDSDLWHAISSARKDGKLVLIMGAGSVDPWVRQQLKEEDELLRN